MKCSACKRQLLRSENPALPARDLAEHLASCDACREFNRRLQRIEGNVAMIPVWPTRAKQAFIEKLLQPTAPPGPPATLPLARPRRWRKLVLRAAGVAAALALAVAGVLLGNFLSQSLQSPTPSRLAKGSEKSGPPHAKAPGTLKQADEPKKGPGDKALPDPVPNVPPLMARLMACDLKLAEAENPRQRVEALAALADELQGETRILAGSAGSKDLKGLARLYERVIREGVVARARGLPAEQRRPVLRPIADRLERTRRDLQELAREEGPASAEPLRQIAAAAREGSNHLQVLMEETP
jgi:hypothetical protein